MSVLTQKLEQVRFLATQASKLFQSHNFKKSLEAYEDCVKFCRKTQQERSIIHNILSTQATLEYVLGDFDKALATLNSILVKDPSHFLSLLRRSQVYKKKGKLVKALKDLQKIFVFCPDNLQISAFKVEIQHLLMKQGSNIEQLSDSQEEDEEEEELLAVNFMNLKQIDRRSSDLSVIKAVKVERKSRVTILGDTFIEYDREDTNDTKEDDTEIVSDKDIRTKKEIQLDDDSQMNGIAAIKIQVIAPKKAKRSILKNKGTSIFIAPQDTQEAKKERYIGRQSKILSMLKNIDGKVIASSDNSIPGILNEVQFRKSSSQVSPLELVIDETEQKSPVPSVKKSGFSTMSKRKSCLKGASFDIPEPKMHSRSSKFDLMDIAQVDGKVIHQKRRMSKDLVPGQKNEDSDSDNESSSHNIFGNVNIEMSEDLKNKLGLSQDVDVSPNKLGVATSMNMNMKKKCSILKKSSMTVQRQESVRDSDAGSPGGFIGMVKMKSKKSVMFNCTL